MDRYGLETVPTGTLTYRQGRLEGLRGYVTIPCFNEEEILPLESILQQCNTNFAILIFINASAACDKQVFETNFKLYQQVIELVKKTEHAVYIALNNEIGPKQAGVGFARKYIMDVAAELAGNQSKAWISGLDADCFVAVDYLEQLENYFIDQEHVQACSIGFKHQAAPNAEMQTAIDAYEMHLRYLKLGLRYAGFPFYHHTIGSSMACRVGAYKLVGGMNTRQAGEDFYFLQKLMPLGFGNLGCTLVFPSARISTRVPFGTGRAMADIASNQFAAYYPMEVFEYLKQFMHCLNSNMQGDVLTHWQWFGYNNSIAIAYFENKKLLTTWLSINKNSKTIAARNKKMMQWLSGNVIFLLLNKWRASLPTVVNYPQQVQQLMKAMGLEHTQSDMLATLQAADLAC